jgi:GNAT superfamily N-acetyltransferase
MTQFSVTPAGPADLADMAALFRAYAAALAVDLGPQGFERELAELPGAYVPPRGALLLARDQDGNALGCIALRPLAEVVCEVKRLYVLPEARGTGLGKALVGTVLDEAARLRYHEIKLDTLDHMQAAIALYRNFGFAPIEPYGTHPYEGLVCFGKALGPD